MCVPDRELEFGSVGFGGEGKNEAPGEISLGTRKRINNKLNLTHIWLRPTTGFQPGSHLLVSAECSRHFATFASLLLLNKLAIFFQVRTEKCNRRQTTRID